ISIRLLQEPRLFGARDRAIEAHPLGQAQFVNDLVQSRGPALVVVPMDANDGSLAGFEPRDRTREHIQPFVDGIDASDPCEIATAPCPSLLRQIETGGYRHEGGARG